MTPSKLYSLEPIALGTPYVESFTGYLLRLAHAHLIYLYVLIKEVIVPLLGKKYLHNVLPIAHRLTSKWFAETGVQINSLNDSTQNWLDVVQELTKRSDLIYLTMLMWKSCIAYRSLIKNHHEWCPYCYADMRITESGIYHPLLWSIRAVKVCILHGLYLQTHCPHCQKYIPILPQRGQLGFCPSCLCWLGDISDYPKTSIADNDELSRAVSIGEILAAAPTIRPIDNEIVVKTIGLIIEALFDGSANALAKHANFNHRTILDWRDGKQILQLESLIKLCVSLKIKPTDFLSGKALSKLAHNPTPVEIAKRKVLPAKKYRKFDSTALENTLIQIRDDNTSEPRPMYDIAESLGYDHSFLIRKFPTLTKEIFEKYNLVKAALSEHKLQEKISNLETEILTLHLKGKYPSHRRLRLAFGAKMRSKRLRQHRKLILRRLGYS